MADQKVKVRIESEDRTSASVKKVESRFQRLTNTVKANALKMTAALGGVVLAFKQIEDTAKLEGQRAALERTLAGMGQDLDEFLGKLDEVAKGTLSQAERIRLASEAVALGLKPQQVAELLEVARVAAVRFGKDTGEAFRELVEGAARGSTEMLNNLGIIVRAGDAYGAYASSVGKTVESLTAQERQTAILNAVLNQTRDTTRELADATNDVADAMQRARATNEDVKHALGRGLTVVMLSFTNVVTGLTAAVTRLVAELAGAVASIVGLGRILPGVGDSLGAAADKVDRFADAARDASDRFTGFAERAKEANRALLNDMLGLADAADQRVTPAMGRASAAIGQAGDASSKAAPEVQTLRDAIGEVEPVAERMQTTMARVTEGVDAARRAVTASAQEFDALAGSMGRAAAQGDPLFPGLSGKTYTHQTFTPATVEDLTHTASGTFYRGRKVRVLPDGRIVWD